MIVRWVSIFVMDVISFGNGADKGLVHQLMNTLASTIWLLSDSHIESQGLRLGSGFTHWGCPGGVFENVIEKQPS